ncbi:hypothetical protein BGX31_004600 [Mortierella sp. GBA43]|nr:hypothetical protein BGX31_004600 [Mortierella sp. GBA43]
MSKNAAPKNNHYSASESESDKDDRSSTSSVEDDQTKQNGHAKESGFITRVTSIPLIHDGVTTLHSYAKDNKVDQLAVKSLDLVEGTFPIVTKPTSEIVTTVKKPIVYVEESSKSAYTQIHSAVDTHVTTPVKSVTSSIASTATTTVNKVTSTAASTRDQITSTVNTHATPLVNGLETIVDRYLPADAEADNEKISQGQDNQATRVADIGRSVSRRVTRRVGVAVAPVTQSAKDLRVRAEQNTVVVKSKDQIHALNVRLNALVEALREHSKELSENVQKAPREASQRVHTRVAELSSKVLTELDNLHKYLKEHGPSLPESVQTRIQPLVDFVNDRYVVVKGEWSKKDISTIQKARNILQLTTEETLPILQNAAQNLKEALHGYQVKAQENVHKGFLKVQDVQSSANRAATRVYHSVHYIFVGK